MIIDWNNAPEWAEWAAADTDNEWCWLEEKPLWSSCFNGWRRISGRSEFMRPQPLISGVSSKDSLCERPKSNLDKDIREGVEFIHPLTEDTLKERGKRYGKFEDQAIISQSLKIIMQNSKGWHDLKNEQKESLEMIQHKIARILNGDPNYIDSWHDIAGYASLVEKSLLEGV